MGGVESILVKGGTVVTADSMHRAVRMCLSLCLSAFLPISLLVYSSVGRHFHFQFHSIR